MTTKQKALITLLICITTATCNAQWWKRAQSPHIHPDKTVTFRLIAPKANEVLLSGDFLPERIPMQKGDRGVWSVTVDPPKPEIHYYSFIVDGLQIIDPANPNVKMGLRISDSIIEIPAPSPAFYEEQDVPRGVLHIHRYKSKTLNVHRGLYVYTPPEYYKDPAKTYPVLYLLHGSGDTEQGWTTVGRANVIADNLLANNNARPMLIVMPFGHAFGPQGSHAVKSSTSPANFENELINEVIPLTEKNYRTAKGSQNRALAGLSMGGFQTIDIGFKHLDTFDWLGVFSAGARGNFAQTHTQGLKNANKNLKLLWIAIGKDDFLYKANENLLKILKTNKVTHTAKITEGAHAWPIWRNYLNELIPKLFK